MRRLEALLPALLLLLFAFALGGEAASLRFPEAWIGRAAILALAILGARDLPDPLRLGRRARWLPAGLMLALLASAGVSPVAGAGRTAILLLPAVLLAIPALARAFARDRDLAAAGWSAAVVAISGVALLEWTRTGGASIGAPLGRRETLALVLAVATPLSARSLAAPGGRRALAVAATVLGGTALLVTGSTWALLGFAAAALLSARGLERGRELAAGLGLLAAGRAVPGIERLLRGDAPEIRAALGSMRGAWRGAMARPLFGWGPESMPWTLAAHRTPLPGVDLAGPARAGGVPAPLQLIYELGVPAAAGAALLVVLFLRSRWRDASSGRSESAALVALLVAGLGGFAANGTLWAAMLALACGAALAERAAASPPRAWGLLFGGAYAAAVVVLLLPPARAHRAYERAAERPEPERQRAAIELAARLDPALPLYEARAAWLPGPPAAERARRAWRAAERAGGVSALWLRAGWLAFEAGDHGAVRRALERSLMLDPFAAAPPFLIFVDSDDRAIDCAARALLAEPRLLAAVEWRRRPRARALAVAMAARWPGIESAWREEFLAQAAKSAPIGDQAQDWVVRLDAGASSAISSQLFGRRSWPAELARVRLDRVAAANVRLAPAWRLASTAAGAFPSTRCAPPR